MVVSDALMRKSSKRPERLSSGFFSSLRYFSGDLAYFLFVDTQQLVAAFVVGEEHGQGRERCVLLRGVVGGVLCVVRKSGMPDRSPA